MRWCALLPAMLLLTGCLPGTKSCTKGASSNPFQQNLAERAARQRYAEKTSRRSVLGSGSQASRTASRGGKLAAALESASNISKGSDAETMRHSASKIFDNTGNLDRGTYSGTVRADGTGFGPREELPMQEPKTYRVMGKAPPAPGSRNSLALNRLDPKGMVPRSLLSKAVSYYKSHPGQIRNKRYLTVIDYTQHSSKRRMYIVDMQRGGVRSYMVSHGRNSDPDHDGYATRFSNTPGSKTSSVGFYTTGGSYPGKHGLSMYLDGRSSTNSNARSRAVVLHGASYVTSKGAYGRSWGCPAVEQRFAPSIIAKLKNGSLVYAYGG